ncbi:CobW family GTP-binding protein [Cohnella panacarvi]|uniref:CobW family GTP-binding protein n=1 Tax=Cohnella panacarvi TaxID=400776 RepID=UPI00047CD845|nr:GTP-binding protein [Cohnella panacarvi]
MNENIVPVSILTGFLGSGKTTLLNKLVSDAKERGLKIAVLLNEVGEANVEAELIGGDVPMAEMLGGCICCQLKGDVAMELVRIVREHRPDVVWIESTGIAQPLDIMDGVAEASLYERAALRDIVTVVDARHLLDRVRVGAGRTLRLMVDQIRAASVLVLNKTDLIGPAEQEELLEALKDWNANAPVIPAVRADVDAKLLYSGEDRVRHSEIDEAHTCDEHCSHGRHFREHSHDHVNALTYYLSKPIDSRAFEALLAGLPEGVYRAKGIVTFSDTTGQFLFQYAYKATDFMRITPQKPVHDVAVFIGEGFAESELIKQLDQLVHHEEKA